MCASRAQRIRPGMPKPVVMVHGAFCGGWVFDAFRKPFETAGHTVLTPDLPGHEARKRVPVANLTMIDYARPELAATMVYVAVSPADTTGVEVIFVIDNPPIAVTAVAV